MHAETYYSEIPIVRDGCGVLQLRTLACIFVLLLGFDWNERHASALHNATIISSGILDVALAWRVTGTSVCVDKRARRALPRIHVAK